MVTGNLICYTFYELYLDRKKIIASFKVYVAHLMEIFFVCVLG